MDRIKALFNVIDRNLFFINPKLDYARITKAITKLANVINNTEDASYAWYIESSHCDCASLIVGAYWHYTEYHTGQWSDGYAALSALGQVFSPGMSGPEEDNEAYKMLAEIAN